MANRIKLGTSACLLGQHVSFDGSRKTSPICRELINHGFELIAICPAVSQGLGVPRPPIRLIGSRQNPRAIMPLRDDQDLTQAFYDQAQQVPKQLCGFILADSAPCALNAPLYCDQHGRKRRESAIGPFVQALQKHLPDLPLIEAKQLKDPIIKENFINRVFVYERWQKLQTSGITAQKLLDFHAQHKYLLMATNPYQQKELGRFLSDINAHDLTLLAANYFSKLMCALAFLATRGSHCNVLLHLSGYLRPYLDITQSQQLRELIEQYQQGKVPLTEPLGLLRDYFNRYPDSYILQQHYLQPYPDELCLRNSL